MVSSFVMVECMMPENLQSECDNLNMFTDKKEWNSWGCTSTKVCVALLLFLWFTINDRRSISDKNGQWPSRQHVELTAEPFELTVWLESSKPRKQRKRRKPWCSKISIFANLHRSKNHSTSSSFQVFPGLSRFQVFPGLQFLPSLLCICKYPTLTCGNVKSAWATYGITGHWRCDVQLLLNVAWIGPLGICNKPFYLTSFSRWMQRNLALVILFWIMFMTIHFCCINLIAVHNYLLDEICSAWIWLCNCTWAHLSTLEQ